jgi:hypothetical protein
VVVLHQHLLLLEALHLDVHLDVHLDEELMLLIVML